MSIIIDGVEIASVDPRFVGGVYLGVDGEPRFFIRRDGSHLKWTHNGKPFPIEKLPPPPRTRIAR